MRYGFALLTWLLMAACSTTGVLHTESSDSQALYKIGFARLESGSNEEAYQYFKRALDMSTDEAVETEALVGMGYALHRLGKYAEAIIELKSALQIDLRISPTFFKRSHGRR